MYQYLKCNDCNHEDNYIVTKMTTSFFICHRCRCKNYPNRSIVENKPLKKSTLTVMKAENLRRKSNKLNDQHKKISQNIKNLQINLLSQVGVTSVLETDLSSLRECHSLVLQDKIALQAEMEKSAKLQERMKRIQASDGFLSKEDLNEKKVNLLKMKHEVFWEEKRLQKAADLAKQIDEIERDASYLNPAEASSLETVLNEADKIILKVRTPEMLTDPEEEMNAILKVQEDARKELECSICLVVPTAPNQVLSCLEHHLICSNCFYQYHRARCPVCRQNFAKKPPTRNRLAEKMIERLC